MHVFIVRVGNPSYAEYTLPFIRDYCSRCDYGLTIYEEPDPAGRPASWQKMLAHRIVPDEQVLILDLDVCPLPYAPPIHLFVENDRMAMIAERRREHRMGLINSLGFPSDGRIHNCGVIVSPASNATFLDEIYKRPTLDRTWEQLHINLEVAKRQMNVQVLDPRWNWGIKSRFSAIHHSHLIWFAHFAGNPSRRVVQSQRLWDFWYGDQPKALGSVRIIYEQLRAKSALPSRGIEVGARDGEFSAAILGAFPDLKLTMIDDWRSSSTEYERARQRTAFAGNRAQLLNSNSLDADFAGLDEPIDFLYLNSRIGQLGVEVIESLYSRLKVGGLFIGSENCGEIRDAVAEHHSLELKVIESTWMIRKP